LHFDGQFDGLIEWFMASDDLDDADDDADDGNCWMGVNTRV
jgi:hypothetical protein